MSYWERQRLADIQAAIDAIRSHLQRSGLSDGLIFDAVRIRLLEIGGAVQALPDDLLATQPSISWRQIARMRDHLANRPDARGVTDRASVELACYFVRRLPAALPGAAVQCSDL